MNCLSRQLSLLTIISIGVSGIALAHHSRAEYSGAPLVEIEGEVTQVLWRNPHVRFDVKTVDKSGKAAVWLVEASSLSVTERRGIRSGLIEVGQRVKVYGHTSKYTAHQLEGLNVLLPTGTEVLIGSNSKPRWSETTIGGARVYAAEGAAVPKLDDPRTPFRVWVWAPHDYLFNHMPAALPLTAAAAKTAAKFDPAKDDPLLQCTPPGMPSTMSNPFPMQMSKLPNGNIRVFLEEFDNDRTIHMVDLKDPATVPPSPLGYSTGKWEGDTLVVKTNRINTPYFNRLGVTQSANLEVVEHFSVSPDGNRLDYVIEVTDPATFTEKLRWQGHWNYVPGAQVKNYGCTLG